MTETLTTIPPFTTGPATFRCLIADAGPNEIGIPGVRYVWRSDCGRYAVGRIGRHCWARRDGRLVGADIASIKLAMLAVVGPEQWRATA